MHGEERKIVQHLRLSPCTPSPAPSPQYMAGPVPHCVPTCCFKPCGCSWCSSLPISAMCWGLVGRGRAGRAAGSLCVCVCVCMCVHMWPSAAQQNSFSVPPAQIIPTPEIKHLQDKMVSGVRMTINLFLRHCC